VFPSFFIFAAIFSLMVSAVGLESNPRPWKDEVNVLPMAT
jgi:hypothetical protein